MGNDVVDLKKVYDSLPDKCASWVGSAGVVGIIKKGVVGYHPVAGRPKEYVSEYNQRKGITKAVARAMEIGSCFGWDVPGINPVCYEV